MSEHIYGIEKLMIFLLGNSAVGKTSFINKYAKDTFDDNYLTTIGIDFVLKNIKLKTGEEITLRLYDTAGQETYRAISYNLVKSADGIILMYDITDRISYDEINEWIENIHKIKGDDFPIILIGNKSDLKEERNISKEEGKELADKYKFPFMETSCKDGTNIDESVNILVSKMFENKKLEKENENQEKEKNGDRGSINFRLSIDEEKEKEKKKKEKKKCCQ